MPSGSGIYYHELFQKGTFRVINDALKFDFHYAKLCLVSSILSEYIIDNSNTDTPKMRNTFVISIVQDLVVTEAIQDISLPEQPSQCWQALTEALLGV